MPATFAAAPALAAAEALKEVYFQDGGRAGFLEEVRFTDIEHLEFDL